MKFLNWIREQADKIAQPKQKIDKNLKRYNVKVELSFFGEKTSTKIKVAAFTKLDARKLAIDACEQKMNVKVKSVNTI